MSVLSLLLCASVARGDETAGTEPAAAAAPAPRGQATESLKRFFTASQEQQGRLRDSNMDMDIEARLPRLKKEGSLHALRQIGKSGLISTESVRSAGDKTVIKEVIARYLAAEAEASKGIVDRQGKPVSIGINTDNYRFRHKATLTTGDHRIFIYQLTPRQNRLGLFKGELWVEAQTGMPLREAGRLIKNPSVFLKKVDFIREYKLIDGISVPTRVSSTIETRLVGKAELEIRYSNYSLALAGQAGNFALGW